ncbi:WSC domain-containing protein [Xylariales sp. AK1849]|nr:WSC domain-containing protein [Xylariales sp. AK1849]
MAAISFPSHGLSNLLVLLVAALIPLIHAAANSAVDLAIYNSSSTYHYVGCYNETTDIPGTEDRRALDGGISEDLTGVMTVSACLDFCAKNQSTSYKYAGLEYSRQCWCANRLSSLSVQLDDADCDLACDGNKTSACGGALRLSLYNLTTGEGSQNAGVSAGTGGVLEMGALMGLVGCVITVIALL